MRVAAVLVAMVVMAADFESPHMVAEFDPVDQPSLGQFREIPIDRGPVESPAGERCGYVRVRPRPAGRFQVFEDRQSCRSASQARGPDA